MNENFFKSDRSYRQAMCTAANSTHSTITTMAKSVYDDFSAPTPFRSARVIVEGKKSLQP